MKGQSPVGLLQGPDHQQGAQTGTPDADPEHITEGGAARGRDGSRAHLGREALQLIDLGGDAGPDGGIRG